MNQFFHLIENRFENNIDCLLTTIDNVPVTQLSQQYWGGKH